MGEYLLRSKTSNRIGCFIRNIQWQYIQARRGVKNSISLSTEDQIERPNDWVVTKNHAEEVDNHAGNSANMDGNIFFSFRP